jgi:hypothetical protein
MPVARKKRAGEFRGYRFSGSDDLVIGAYGKQQQRKRYWIAVAGMALIGGAAWLLMAQLPGQVTGTDNGIPIAVECRAPNCGQRMIMKVPAGNVSFPLICPKCKTRACYKLWECRSCGYQFVHRKPERVVACERCGSRNVGSAETVREREASGPSGPQGPNADGR